ncbi:LCP family protein [Streptacidiphilus sp. ASG 303]|uniref:LCP family protein n=1 Tax=Streptacidiphilus sp. ASG 303 TaxID=2896847 RepID=UPI001E4ECA06|nr:LCP family protein [Streptacidiphilus sp. ASG 303]MCD0482594.1 LCP family protein [Streptacidiphilus sp. ASG 303]
MAQSAREHAAEEQAAPAGNGGAEAAGPAPRRRRRWPKVVGLVAGVAVLAAAGTAYGLYRHLDSNIHTGVDLGRELGTDRPAKVAAAARDILVLGSDSRAGGNQDLGGGDVGGARSDTAMVVHIPAGGGRATVVSIPRDTLVTRPSCTGRNGAALPAAKRVMFNSVYSLAGPACVVKTVEKMSGVRMDHYVEIDFVGFKDLVDTIGGVTVRTTTAIDDRHSGLHLAPGTHRLDGTQALAFVRTRHGIGDGSDLGRIGLQQQFMTALVAEVKKQDLLGSPVKSYKMADAATKLLTTDSDLGSLTALAEFGRSVKGVDPDTMETLMLPVRYDRIDPNRVVAAEPQASALWKAIREDSPVPESAKHSPAAGGGVSG